MTDNSPARDEQISGRLAVFSAERGKAFIDAVVAIAMTLLILPLMESLGEGAASDLTTARWFDEHQWQLISFALSFAVIAMFWINHHRLFARVEQVTIGLLWVSMLWLLSIVWLPVATSMSGRMSSTDSLARVVYIGSMIIVCLLTLALRLYLRGHRSLHSIPEHDIRRGIAVDLSMAVLFGLALAVAVIFPAVGYIALFLMFFTGPVQRLFARVLRVDKAKAD